MIWQKNLFFLTILLNPIVYNNKDDNFFNLFFYLLVAKNVKHQLNKELHTQQRGVQMHNLKNRGLYQHVGLNAIGIQKMPGHLINIGKHLKTQPVQL